MRLTGKLLGSIACFLLASSVAAQAQQQNDCRPQKKTPREDLMGEWLDKSNNRKVDITQSGMADYSYILDGKLVQTRHPKHIVATYIEPVQCKYPGSEGKPVYLPTDFEGDLDPKGSMDGGVYICFWREGSNGRRYTESVVKGDLLVNVSDDGKSIDGTFKDPVKGTQPIHVTRLTQPNSDSDPKMVGFIYVNSPAGKVDIYQERATDSQIKLEYPNGMRIVFTEVVEQNGQLWYRTRIPYAEPGWIQGSGISCSPPVPVFSKPLPLVDSGLGNAHAPTSIVLGSHG